MKIGGRKNDGAWYRANKFILKAAGIPALQEALTTKIGEIETLETAYDAYTDMIEKAGLAGTDLVPASQEAWVQQMAEHGIARQVWNGVLSFDTYEPDGGGGFKKQHEEAFRDFSIDLRKEVTRIMFLTREVMDLGNKATREQGNPSGIADASED